MKKGKIYLVLAIILAFAFFGCSSEDESDVTVKYQITGPATTATSIYYTNTNGNTDSISNVAIPWEKTLSFPSTVRVAAFSATIMSNTETYTSKIFANGKEVGSSISSSSVHSVSAYW